MKHSWPHLKLQHFVVNGEVVVAVGEVPHLGVVAEAVVGVVGLQHQPEVAQQRPQKTPMSGGPTPRGARTCPPSSPARSTGFMGRKLTGVKSRVHAPGRIILRQELTNEGQTSLKFPTLVIQN